MFICDLLLNQRDFPNTNSSLLQQTRTLQTKVSRWPSWRFVSNNLTLRNEKLNSALWRVLYISRLSADDCEVWMQWKRKSMLHTYLLLIQSLEILEILCRLPLISERGFWKLHGYYQIHQPRLGNRYLHLFLARSMVEIGMNHSRTCAWFLYI